MKETPKVNKPDAQFHMVFQEPGEKEAIMKKYGIISESLSKQMEKRSDGWYVNDQPIEKWDEIMKNLDIDNPSDRYYH